ncbi:MAG TPA: hypothetical protein VKS21_06120, partial [Spirochaetota bacterium]|nr:hypothetical protein [Spirochaetota bacterium]
EAVFSGGRSVGNSNFTAGSTLTTNLYKDTNLYIINPGLTAGYPVANGTGIQNQTVIITGNPLPYTGTLTRWAVYLQNYNIGDGPGGLYFKIWQGTGEPYSLLYNIDYSADAAAGSNSFNLTPVIEVTNLNWHISAWGRSRRWAFWAGWGDENCLVYNNGGGPTLYQGGDDTSGSGYSSGNVEAAVYAEGYAWCIYNSVIFDTGSSDPDYAYIFWEENIPSGTALEVKVRAADVSNNVTGQSWYTVQNQEQITNALDNLQYIQYQVKLTADTDGTATPSLDNLEIYYDLNPYPEVSVQQAGLTNRKAYYVSNISPLVYVFTYTNISGYDGTAAVYGCGFDAYINLNSNDLIGTYIIDNSIPAISNLQCWRSASFNDTVPNNTSYYDDVVSYTWSRPGSLSGDHFYMEYNQTPGLSIDGSETLVSTNTNRLNQGLLAGTNYFHVKVRTGANRWGNELIFTNIYKPTPFTVSEGDFTPLDSTIVKDQSNVIMLQLKINTGSNEGVTISNVTFSAAGSGHDLLAVSKVKLYDDNNNGELNLVADTLLAEGKFNSNNGMLIFSNLDYVMNVSAEKYWLLTYNMSGSAANGDTFQINLTNSSNITVRGNTSGNPVTAQGPPVTGCIKTVVDIGTLSLAEGTYNPGATNVSNNAQNLVMLQLALTADNSEDITVTNLIINSTGSLQEALDIESGSLGLFIDKNNNGVYDLNDSELDSGLSFSADNGAVTFSGFSFTVKANTTSNLIVLASLNGNAADGENFYFSVSSNSHVAAAGGSSGQQINVQYAPVTGGTHSVSVDTSPPVFTPYSIFISSNPAPQISNLYIYIQADESVQSTNNDGSTNLYPLVRVIQGNNTNLTTNTGGSSAGPFTNIYNVLPVDGTAQVWAEGMDFTTPTPNYTNMPVGTFMVDTTPAGALITNIPDYTSTNTNSVTVKGYAAETNIILSVNVFSASNAGTLISSQSNIYLESSNFTISNVILSNSPDFTNWIELHTVDAAGNTSNNIRKPVIYKAAGEPHIISTKSNSIQAPVSGGYPFAATNLVPGSTVSFFIKYTNQGDDSGYSVSFTEKINTNFAGILSNSITGADTVEYATNGIFNGYTPVNTVDYQVDKIRFTVNNVAAAGSGTISYKIIIR